MSARNNAQVVERIDTLTELSERVDKLLRDFCDQITQRAPRASHPLCQLRILAFFPPSFFGAAIAAPAVRPTFLRRRMHQKHVQCCSRRTMRRCRKMCLFAAVATGLA
jgi:hypothetical protein